MLLPTTHSANSRANTEAQLNHDPSLLEAEHCFPYWWSDQADRLLVEDHSKVPYSAVEAENCDQECQDVEDEERVDSIFALPDDELVEVVDDAEEEDYQAEGYKVLRTCHYHGL